MVTYYTIDPNMGFLNPIPGVAEGIPEAPTGLDYATLTTNSLTIIGAHGHTGAPNDGKQIVTAAININGDLTFNSFNLTNVNSTRYINQSAVLSGAGDLKSTYVYNNNLYYNNASGIPVQITSGSSVVVPPGNNLTYSYLAVTSNHTILSTDSYTFFDSNTGLTFTLPSAMSVASGTYYIIKDRTGGAASSNITIQVAISSGDLIDGLGTYVITTNYGSAILIANGSNGWRVQNGQIVNEQVAAGAGINVNKLASGTSAQILLNNSTPTPSWTSMSGDVTIGNTGATTVGKINGVAIGAGAPADTYLLQAYDSANAAWTAVGGDIYCGSPGNFYVNHISGPSFEFATSTVTTTTSLGSSSLVVFASSASGEIFLTLPAVSFGKFLMIKDYTGHAATNNIVISGATGNIDGASSYTLNQNYASVILCSDGTNWFAMGVKGT